MVKRSLNNDEIVGQYFDRPDVRPGPQQNQVTP